MTTTIGRARVPTHTLLLLPLQQATLTINIYRDGLMTLRETTRTRRRRNDNIINITELLYVQKLSDSET